MHIGPHGCCLCPQGALPWSCLTVLTDCLCCQTAGVDWTAILAIVLGIQQVTPLLVLSLHHDTGLPCECQPPNDSHVHAGPVTVVHLAQP